ncbi:MAG TPA: prepilin-type N-terminal cleavage/methylation domain-containing protein [bacterium]|nr:prepilin-type N-terminal cleavage/methylation domain-containing protein [bacterium]HEX68556.1 prepilin-type N-terminal cleavage/methylation domain-containing protein [bacterium]
MRGFTLIELVIVVAILSLLIFASLPTFREFLLSARLRQGCYDVIAALRTARGLAISNRVEYMTLFYTTMRDNRNLPNFKYFDPRWSAVCIYTQEEGIIGGWKRLPDNIYFDYLYGDTNSGFKGMETGGDEVPNSAKDPHLPYPNETADGDSMLVVIFKSNGQAVKFSSTGRLVPSHPDIILRDSITGDTAEIKVLGSTGRIYLYSFMGRLVQE